MWTIRLGDDTLHDPSIGIAVSNPTLTQQLNAADQMTFTITPSHALYQRVRAGVLSERVSIYRDGNPVSYGRVLAVESRPLSASCDVTVEGELAYLNDAIKHPYDFNGTPAQMLRMFVDEYTMQCGGDLQVGRVAVEDSNDYIVRGSKRPVSLLQELLDKTVGSTTGGVLQIRHEDGVRYLDWTAEPDASGSQPIAKGSNLLDITSTVDGVAVVTAIMPIGAEVAEGGFVQLPAGADGKVSSNVYRRGDCLYSKPLVDRYGWHAQVVEWADVTLEANLRRKAIAAVRALKVEPSVDVGAVDLRDAGYDIDAIALGQLVAVSCDDIETQMYVTACEFVLDDPTASTYTFGRIPRITEQEAAADEGGWSGQNDDTNYFWHASSEVVYNEDTSEEYTREIDDSYMSPLSKYDLPDNINWNNPTYEDSYQGQQITDIPLAHVRVYRTGQGPNLPPASTELHMGTGRQGTLRVPNVLYVTDASMQTWMRLEAAGFMQRTDNGVWLDGSIETTGDATVDGDLTAGGEVGDGDGNILSLKITGVTGSVQVPVVANGETPAEDRPTVTFPSPIVGSSPSVFFTIGSSPSVWHMRDLRFGYNLIGNSSDGYTGFYVRCVNTGSNTGTPWVRWLAVWN